MEIQFKNEKLTSLLKDFYEVSGVISSVFDSDGNEIARYPVSYTPICERLRCNCDVNTLCMLSDKAAIEQCKKTLKTRVYTCHANLTECIAPVLYNDSCIGFIMVGQIINKDTFSREKFLSYAAGTGINKDEAAGLMKKTIQLEGKSIQSYLKIIESLARYIYLENYIEVDSKNTEQRINNYTDEHLSGKIVVDDYCMLLDCSRVECYRIFSKIFRSTVSSYIKERRIKKACHLLLTNKYRTYEVSDRCGFNDYNYFSKEFKKHMGMSPSEYRKNNR